MKRLFEQFFFWLRKVLGFTAPPVIMAYRGYGTSQRVFIRGHVLADRLLYESEKYHKRYKNIRAMISRYMSLELANVRVGISFEGQYKEVKTGEDGGFEVVFQFDPPLEASGWLPVRYEVLDQIGNEEEPLEQKGEAYILEAQQAFGVISDIDDTILISHSSSVRRKLQLILYKNSKTRLPFKGVSTFYQALHDGVHHNYRNPVFYVSSSEWNLYDFLEDFFRVRRIPKGPFLLKRLKTSVLQLLKSGGGSHHHKLDKIKHLLNLFTELNFILIGDSSQKDAEIYSQVARDYPDRILVIYIRDVSGKKKEQLVREMASTLVPHQTELLLVKDTAEAAEDALQRGFINESEYQEVKQDVEAAKREPILMPGE